MRKLRTVELKRLSVEEFKKSPKNPIVILLDNVRSLYNVGAAFRTADAFLIEKICLCGITASPSQNDIHKTALGAENSVAWIHYPKAEIAIQHYKSIGYHIIIVEQTDESILLSDFSIEKGGRYLLIFGHEVKGVKEELIHYCDHALEIPQFGIKHSLNVSVSIGIVLWEFVKTLQK
ncbi:MAG: TrmH family RNA methyltransferase [Flavobacteriales bacterium AspAUS03]